MTEHRDTKHAELQAWGLQLKGRICQILFTCERHSALQKANTAAPSGTPPFTGWCLDKEDLCVAKLCAHREKDLNFVAAVITASLVDAAVIAGRLGTVPEKDSGAIKRALAWIAARS